MTRATARSRGRDSVSRWRGAAQRTEAGRCAPRRPTSAARDSSTVCLSWTCGCGGDAPAGSGHDVIQFDPAILPGTITLDGNQLVVGDDLTIIGPGPLQLTIDAADRSRHFEINPGVTVDMSGFEFEEEEMPPDDAGEEATDAR